MIPPRLIVYGIGLLAVCGCVYTAYQWAYSRGQAERTAYYAPLLAAAEAAKDAADNRAALIEETQRLLSETEVAEYETRLTELQDRAHRAESAYAGSLRKLAAAGGCEVPETSGAGSFDGSAGIDGRIERTAAGIGTVGVGCEADALRLQALQDVIRQYQALTTAAPADPTPAQ